MMQEATSKKLSYSDLRSIISNYENNMQEKKPKWVMQLEAAGIKVCPSIYRSKEVARA